MKCKILWRIHIAAVGGDEAMQKNVIKRSFKTNVLTNPKTVLDLNKIFVGKKK